MAQDNCQAQAQQLLDEEVVFKINFELAQLASVAQHQQAQAVQFRQCKAGRVGVVQDVGPVLVVVTV